jgi:hypothetical protein
MKNIAGLAALLALCACESETNEVRIEMPDDMPVTEQFEMALDIINALKAEDFPKPFDRTSKTAHPDDITSADLTLSAVVTKTEAPLVRDSEHVYIVCTIHDQQNAKQIENECRRQILEQLEPGRLALFAVDPFQNSIGHSLVLGDAKQRIEGRFGEPQELKASQADDRSSAAKLNFYRLAYPGLVFVVGQSEDRARSWIETIELSDGHPALKFGLGIGVSADTVASVFDPANMVRSASDLRLATAVYEDLNDISVESNVELTFRLDSDGIVQKILIETIAL